MLLCGPADMIVLLSVLFTFRCWPLPGPVVDQLMTFLSFRPQLFFPLESSSSLSPLFGGRCSPRRRRDGGLNYNQVERECARNRHCHRGHRFEGVTPAIRLSVPAGSWSHESSLFLRGPRFVFLHTERDGGWCAHTHTPLRTFSSPRPRPTKSWIPRSCDFRIGKKGRLSTFSNKRQRRTPTILSSHFLIHGCKPSTTCTDWKEAFYVHWLCITQSVDTVSCNLLWIY